MSLKQSFKSRILPNLMTTSKNSWTRWLRCKSSFSKTLTWNCSQMIFISFVLSSTRSFALWPQRLKMAKNKLWVGFWAANLGTKEWSSWSICCQSSEATGLGKSYCTLIWKPCLILASLSVCYKPNAEIWWLFKCTILLGLEWISTCLNIIRGDKTGLSWY